MITLEKIIYDVQSDLNDFSNANYMRMLQWLVRGVTDLNMHHVSNLEVAYLTADASGQVDLPNDYIAYSKIGVCENGLIKVFGINDNMCLRRKTECEVGLAVQTASLAMNGQIPYVSHYRDGLYVSGLYGLGGGFRSTYYRIDKQKRKIILGGDIPLGEIVLEYLSSGINLSGKTYVDDDMREVLIALLHWRIKEHSPSRTVSEGEKERARQMYDYQARRLSKLRKKFTISELMDTIYASYKQTIKR
ncbi:hypothetical protein [Methanoculleus sp.]|jgi:hypothetical protein|uniref:hypothetical protein n=1 Tax=Methanoculleus sp. TaxID=90427 RepID=UPI0025DDEA9C|nr:hypothetical protein [Methanoculleus sp.]MCK9319778.1 hypothetical protein [Methanoculleus sp.]